MENLYSKSIQIRFSQCDHSGRLAPDAALSLCMDLAGDHATHLGNGVAQLRARGLHWVAVKTRLRLYRPPALGERCTALTWPEQPGRVRSNRDYLLRAGDETLLAARTEWAVLDAAGRFCPTRELYDPALVFRSESALEGPFRRFPGVFQDPPFAAYTVRSTDIDLAGHMNNAAYLRMLLGLYSTAERDARPLRELELHYRAAAYEGDRLLLRRRAAEGGTELQSATPEGAVILLAYLAQDG